MTVWVLTKHYLFPHSHLWLLKGPIGFVGGTFFVSCVRACVRVCLSGLHGQTVTDFDAVFCVQFGMHLGWVMDNVIFQNGGQYGRYIQNGRQPKLKIDQFQKFFFPGISSLFRDQPRQLRFSRWLPTWPPYSK